MSFRVLSRTRSELASFIDHTLLRPDATRVEIERLCDEAARWGFAAVCVNSAWVKLAARCLRGTLVRVSSTVGFPLGAVALPAKAVETRAARRDGAAEFDMVIQIGALKSRDDAFVLRDIEGVVRGAGDGGRVKVILETSCLTRAEKVRGCRLAERAGAHFVKTSSGFLGGATAGDVRLLRRTVGDRLGVKAAGGIRDAATALRMIRAGASRIGTSAGVAIVKGMPSEGKAPY